MTRASTVPSPTPASNTGSAGVDAAEFQPYPLPDHPLFAAGMDKQQVFLPIFEKPEIAAGIALLGRDLEQRRIGAAVLPSSAHPWGTRVYPEGDDLDENPGEVFSSAYERLSALPPPCDLVRSPSIAVSTSLDASHPLPAAIGHHKLINLWVIKGAGVSSDILGHVSTPVRSTMLPYARQIIDEDDRKAVNEVLRGDWLTTGPAVPAFESALCGSTGARRAVAMNSGTAALHAATSAIGIGPGDEVIVPAISFVASANCVLYQRATPVFADICRDTMNIDPADVERKITARTKAIVAVDFAGHPCDHDALREIALAHGLKIISDAAHSLGATYRDRNVGTLQDVTAMSFHPVKMITTGEGGAVLTNDDDLAKKVRSFRHHGIDIDLHARARSDSYTYDVTSLGYNYRITDLSCALGSSQIKKLPQWIARRRAIAAMYEAGLGQNPMLELPTQRPDCKSAWHLYVVRLNLDTLTASRKEVFAAMRGENIGVNVHYIPIPWLTLYSQLGYERGQWAVAETEYERIMSIPMYPGMTDSDVSDVVAALEKVYRRYRR